MNVTTFLAHHEMLIRLGSFIGVFILLALFENRLPRRILTVSKMHRWLSNISVAFIYSLIVRAIFPTAVVGFALFAQNQHWGIFNYFQFPLWIAVIISVLILDLVIYWQHVILHAVPLLWRLHRMHHADLDFDMTTGLRFHPIEIVLSMLIKILVVCLLGAPALGVIIFEIILNATSMFNHSNIKLPQIIDRMLRRITVTPDMHRVHHSILISESKKNFGFNLSCWDRIFNTYQAQPLAGHEEMIIGITIFRDQKICVKLFGMLTIPFIGKANDYTS